MPSFLLSRFCSIACMQERFVFLQLRVTLEALILLQTYKKGSICQIQYLMPSAGVVFDGERYQHQPDVFANAPP